MDAFFNSLWLVALSEIGDKTQLLALYLTCRYRKPWVILWGILLATLLNHALASGLGQLISLWLGPETLRWVVGLSFLGFAAWVLVPDKDDDFGRQAKWGAFTAATVLFFIAEMGDKTQLATVALGARFGSWIEVGLGSTAGLMLANVPVLFWGQKILKRVSMLWVRRISSLSFAVFGLWTLLAT